MSTAAIIHRDPNSGEAIVTFPPPPTADDAPWRPGRQTESKVVHTGLYFEDPYGAPPAKRRKATADTPSADPADPRWRHFPTLTTAVRMGEYLAEYLPAPARVESVHLVTPDAIPDAPVVMPAQLYLVINVNSRRLKLSAGTLANDLLATTAYDAINDRVTQQPEMVMVMAAEQLLREAQERTTNDVMGQEVHTF